MVGMKVKIEHKEGRWLVNGKRWPDLNIDEANFMRGFFTEMKLAFEKEDIREFVEQ